MACESCGDKPKKCNKDFTKAVIEIDNPEQITLMRKVTIPASMGDDTTVPPVVGKYHNVLLYYEANSKTYLYSSDGIPTQLVNGVTDYEAAVNLPQINGHTLLGNKTGDQLGLQNKLTAGENISIDSDNVISAVDTTYGPATDTEIGLVKPGDGLEVDANGTMSISDIEQYAHFFDTVADMKAAANLVAGDYARTSGFYGEDDCGGASYKIRAKTGEDVVDEHILFDLYDNTLVAEYVPQTAEVYIKQFGAKGDATADDTEAIQTCVDYCIENSLICVINSTLNYYKTTLPIILKTNRTIDTGYWTSSASKVVGQHHGNCRIVKIGDDVYTDNPNPSINNVNATFIACNPTSSAQTVTGIYIDELSLENYTNTSGDKTVGSLGLWTNISRSTYMNLNIKAYRGIYAYCFSCKFENIVYSCVENAMELDNGTSNFFRFMYAPGCNNPYKVRSAYSTMMNVCGDACTGTIFNLRGFGLTLENCGCESPRAQYIFQTSGYVNNIKISNFMMHRQTGDSDNNLAVSDCSIIKMADSAYVEFDCFSILEGNYIGDGNNSYFFEVASPTNTRACTSLKNFCYYKNYTGTNNPRILLWKNRPALATVQRYANPTMEFNYIVSPTNKIYPMIGGYQPSDDMAYASALNSNDISYTKTIRLDTKDQYHNGANDDMRYSGSTNVGDLFLYNDPKGKNALGYTVGSKESGIAWTMNQIPIILSGSTDERPTSNLFEGLCYFDTTLNKPIWRKTNDWVDATGTSV